MLWSFKVHVRISLSFATIVTKKTDVGKIKKDT